MVTTSPTIFDILQFSNATGSTDFISSNDSVHMTSHPVEMTPNETNSSNIVTVQDWKSLFLVLSKLAPYSLAIDRYVTPVWIAIGFVGNLFSARIWTLRRMRKCNASAAYLATLAISDFLFLLLTVGNELQYPWMVGALDLQGWCQIWNMLQMTTQYISLLLVFAFTVERFISVCRPFSCEKFSRTSRSSKIITAIVCISLALALPQGVFWNVSPEIGSCTIRMPTNSTNYPEIYAIWNWSSDLVMFGVVPIVAFILNLCVLKQIRKVGKLYINSETLHRHVGARCISTTATMMWISFYLIFSKLSVTIVFLLQSQVPLGGPMSLDNMSRDPTWQSYLTYYTARKLIEELAISHHACNVFIYAATSKVFRQHLKFLVVQIFWYRCRGVNFKSSPPGPIDRKHYCMHPKR